VVSQGRFFTQCFYRNSRTFQFIVMITQTLVEVSGQVKRVTKMRKLVLSIFKKARKPLTGKGLGRLPLVNRLNWFLYQHLKPKGYTLVEVQGNKMYVDAGDTGVAPALLMGDTYEKCEVNLFKKLVSREMVVVDIGANFGYYTLIAANLVGDKGKVFAFEPEPENYALLVRNIEVNGYKNIIPVQKAISNKTGTTNLFLFEKNKGQHTIYEPRSYWKSIVVESITLDDYFSEQQDSVDVIKMDIEGAEILALLGMDRIIKQAPNLKIFTEFVPTKLRAGGSSPEEFLNKVTEYGFKLHLINERKQLIEPIDIDRLMQRRESKMNLFLER